MAPLENGSPRLRHPARKMGAGTAAYIAACAALSCLATDEICYSVVIIAFMGILGVRAVSLKRCLAVYAAPLVFTAVGALTVALERGAEPQSLFSVRVFGAYTGFSTARLVLSLRLFLKAFGCIVSASFLCLTAPAPAILGLCHQSPLPKVLADLMSLTYRFIFDLTAIGEEMRRAQQARLSNLTMRTAVRGSGILFSSVFIRAYKRSGDTWNAMEARCYQGVMPYVPRAVSGSERLAAVAATVGMAGLIALIKTRIIPWRL